MVTAFDKNKIQSFLKDLFTITGMIVSFYSADLKSVCAFPNEFSSFCMKLRKNISFNNECETSDTTARIECFKQKRPIKYMCHAGLTEVIFPIIYKSEVVGFMMLGEFLTKEKMSSKALDVVQSKYNVNKCDIEKDYDNLPVFSEEEIDSIIKISERCINNLLVENILLQYEDPTMKRIEEYIDDNLDKKLSAKFICSNFYISKNKLYELVDKEYHTSFAKFIQMKRINKAKDLLINTDYSVIRISETVGYDQYRNFLHLFKECEGMSPLKYRKSKKLL